MQDNESQGENESINEGATELRINIPTAASVAEGATFVPSKEPEPDNAGSSSSEIPRLVGRPLAERLLTQTTLEDKDEPKTGTFVLPDWSEPPTGLVPRVLLDDEVAQGSDADFIDVGLRGPSWREDGSDWDNDADLAFLIEEDTAEDAPVIAGRVEPPSDSPFGRGFETIDMALGVSDAQAQAKWDAAFGNREDDLPAFEFVADLAGQDDQTIEELSTVRRLPLRQHRRRHQSGAAGPSERNMLLATATGLAIGAIAVLCFHFGASSTIALVAVAVTLAAAELFSSLQRAGYRPATLVGLIAIPVMIVGTYLHGPIAIPFTTILLMIGFAIWGVAGLTHREPVTNLGVTALVVLWTGILGSFAGLLLNQNSFPHRNGVAFVIGAIALTVAHDVGSFAIGHRFGRHPIAPKVSPGKTREGLVGGSVLTMVVAVALVAHIHPFTLSSAIALGILVCVFAPLGDLFESVAKRDLGLKDMGKILPAHGGIFDRIDAMLFVLPVCYLLIRLYGLR